MAKKTQSDATAGEPSGAVEDEAIAPLPEAFAPETGPVVPADEAKRAGAAVEVLV